MNLFTIGYEGASVDDVLHALTVNGIQTLVDVRFLPLSRKYGFSKSIFCNYLQSNNIQYLHFKNLGCPSDIRTQYKIDHNWASYTKRYMSYMATQEPVIEDLIDIVKSSNCCLLCFESDVNYCHRLFIANRVKEIVSSINIVNLRLNLKKDRVLYPEIQLV